MARIQRNYGPLYLLKSGAHLSLRYFGHALEEAVAKGVVAEARVNVSIVLSVFFLHWSYFVSGYGREDHRRLVPSRPRPG